MRMKRRVPAPFVLLPVCPAEFGGRHSDLTFEFDVKIIDIAVADFFSNLVHLHIIAKEQFLGVFDTHMVEIGVEIFPDLFAENLAEIRTVVAKKRRDCFQCEIACVIVLDVIENVVNHALLRRAADGG